MMNKKRNLECTNLNKSNAFSILNNTDVVSLAVGMGVDMGNTDFQVFNVISYLEIARHSLENKIQCANNTSVPQLQEDVSNLDSILSDNSELEDGPEQQDFILVSHKRVPRKPNRLSLSRKGNKTRKGKENLVSKPGRKGEEQVKLDSPPPIKRGRKTKKTT
jgi:phage-related protein